MGHRNVPAPLRPLLRTTAKQSPLSDLPPAAQAHVLVLAVRSTFGRTRLVPMQTLLTHSPSTPNSRGDTTKLTMLHGGLADPVDTWVIANAFVHGVHHDNFEPLV